MIRGCFFIFAARSQVLPHQTLLGPSKGSCRPMTILLHGALALEALFVVITQKSSTTAHVSITTPNPENCCSQSHFNGYSDTYHEL